jgi:hypothetical protein
MKNKSKHMLVLAALAVTVGFCTSNLSAQDRGDAAQRREDRIKRIRERYVEVKAEEDWKKIEPLIGKVMDAQRETFAFAFGSGFGGGGGGGRGGGRGGGGSGGSADANQDRPRLSSVPEIAAVQQAVEDKAPADEVKEKVAKLREARKARETALEKAQDDLRKALSPRQEAGAILAGLLK